MKSTDVVALMLFKAYLSEPSMDGHPVRQKMRKDMQLLLDTKQTSMTPERILKCLGY